MYCMLTHMCACLPFLLSIFKQGLYEGVMPGNVILRAVNARDRDGAGGGKAGGGERAREHGLSSSASMATEETRKASSSTSSNLATPHHPASITAPATTGAQPRSKMWQPSFGPGSPQIPAADIARASSKTRVSANGNGVSSGRVLGKPTAGQAAAIAAAAGRTHPGQNARSSDSGVEGGRGAGGGWGGSSRALGGEVGERRGGGGSRGNGSAQPAPGGGAVGDLLRGAQAWMGIETGEEWEGEGESDEGSSDEDDVDDDLVLRR